jgi:hypothetical protein
MQCYLPPLSKIFLPARPKNTPFLGTFLKAAEIFFQQPSFSANLCRKSLEKSGCAMQCYLPPLSKIFLPARPKSSAAGEKKNLSAGENMNFY